MSVFRLAVIGAGPAGIYAADIMQKEAADLNVSIDLFDELPTPYGLVRYGVSPDHPRIKGIINALKAVVDSGDIRFFGNVKYGRDLTLTDLREHYHAVIFATGAIRDANLDIPGIDLEGSYGAAEFVSWFDAHPDVSREWPLEAEQIAVIGNGNVALDITRMLSKYADDLLPTEIPDHIYQLLNANKVQDVHVFGRRGPAQVKFTPLELREAGEVPGVDMVLNPADFEYSEADEAAMAANKQLLVIGRIFKSWLDREPGESKRRIHMHFYSKPVEIIGENGRVSAIKIERQQVDAAGQVSGTGEFREIPVQAFYRAVGYFGSALDMIPFDENRGIIPNAKGAVIDESGELMPGIFATGWIKRGPVGLIGATKSDAMETIQQVLDQAPDLPAPKYTDLNAIVELLGERGISFTDGPGWGKLDNHEIALGEPHERARIKVADRTEMVEIAKSAQSK